MLTDTELSSLLADLESDRVERKASLSDRGRIRQAICAFANDLPDHRETGVLFIGVHDDGSCAHLPITDELQRTLADMRSDGNILPFPTRTVQKRTVGTCDVAVVEVQPSLSPPVRYDGRVWIRVGPRRGTATLEEERRLTEKRRAGDLTFDQRPVQGATVADLDLERFQRQYLPSAVAPDALSANDRNIEHQLAALRFLPPNGVPNAAAILVFGRNPVAWIPGAYLQFLRMDGTELTDPIRHQREITGPLPEMLSTLDEILAASISVRTDVRAGTTEVKHPDYPIVALQQLARNAVLHRTYETSYAPARVYWFSDRIEIHSRGGHTGR
jgi:ATP-dependent DNA helicase RecG